MCGNLNITNTIRRLACVAVLTVAVAGGAAAQGRTREVYITMAKELCDVVRPVPAEPVPRQVYVVANERDLTLPAGEELPGERCKWKFKLTENQSLDITPFSLRIDGLGRTPCRRAKRIGPTFQLVFDMPDRGNARDLQIERGHFDYVREVKALSDDDVPCWEEEMSMPRTLYNVQFDIENIHLQLYEKKPVACGVILNKVASLAKAKKGNLVPIQSEELVRVVNWQELRGRNCYAPGITPPAAIARSLIRKVPLEIRVK